MDCVALRFATEGVEVEPRLPQLLECRRGMQGVQSNDNASLQTRRDLRRSTGLKQLLQSPVAKGSDHFGQL
jgi:hypothetical protein